MAEEKSSKRKKAKHEAERHFLNPWEDEITEDSPFWKYLQALKSPEKRNQDFQRKRDELIQKILKNQPLSPPK